MTTPSSVPLGDDTRIAPVPWICPVCFDRRFHDDVCDGGVRTRRSHERQESPWLQLRRAKEVGDRLYADVVRLSVELDSLRTQLAAAQRDSERLTWLSTPGHVEHFTTMRDTDDDWKSRIYAQCLSCTEKAATIASQATEIERLNMESSLQGDQTR